MNYDYYENTACKYDEFISSGICASNPSLSALQEILLVYLKELAYYIFELKKFGANNELIKEHIIESISGIINNVDYNQNQFQNLLAILVQDLSQAKILYADLSKKNKIPPKFLKCGFKSSTNFSMPEIIKKGEKYFIQRNSTYTAEQKNLIDLMILIIKRLCLKIIQIKSYKIDYEKAYETLLTLLNTMNFDDMEVSKIKAIIEESVAQYRILLTSLYNIQEEVYGKRESVYIPFNPRNGKAILVSGIDMTQLEVVLNATKDRNIDVYTHGMTMLMAHTLSKFRSYPHLIGHFGKGSDNSLFDFAAFPGAILMTKYLFQKVNYLCRGRLFTTDTFAPNGIAKIEDGNFEPLIQAALHSKGFTKAQQEVIFRVGFRQTEIEKKMQEIVKKMQENKIRHLYFIGILHNENEYKCYFEKFLELMPKDCFAISLSHEKNEENILHVDSFYDYLLIYKVLDEINKNEILHKLNITIFITKCDQYTVTNVINFINMGVKHVFLCKCIPTLINPTLAETIKKTFGIEEYSIPKDDIEKTLQEQGG